jgi:hypothetical protein
MPYRIPALAFSLLLASFHAHAASDPTFQTEHFSGSANCGSCHDGMTADDGTEVSFRKPWSATLMANSARDPFWRAKFASELARNPQMSDILNDKCLRCHAPMAALEAEIAGTTLTTFGDDGVLNEDHPLHDAAMDGVSCTACHQLQPAAVEDSHSGNFEIDPAVSVAFGPRSNPLTDPMTRTSGFTPTHGAHMSDSSSCGGCHTLKTPTVDAFGVVVSETVEDEFPEQTPYIEWEHSDFGPGGRSEQSCQGCHMPRIDAAPLANRPISLAAREDVASHDFLGANTLMLEILGRNAEALGIPSADFRTSIVKARKFLRDGVDLEIAKADVVSGQLALDVKVINRAGHKFPTSFPSRRAFLHLMVADAEGNILFESGRTKAGGRILGHEGELDLTTYEPHYDTITRQDQVQIYESVMGDTDGAVTYTLLRADGYLKDNRIPPAGFDKQNVPDDVAVKGDAIADGDFVGGSDTVHYRIAVPTGVPLRVRVELNYQPLSYAFARDLFLSGDDPAITEFREYFTKARNKVETVAVAESTVR